MNGGSPAADWQVAREYSALMLCDRRAFAWEWLRRTPRYRRLWAARERLPVDASIRVGLLAWIDPAIPAPEARPIWSPDVDPKVLQTRAASRAPRPGDCFDVLALADYVSISVDQANREHWLI